MNSEKRILVLHETGGHHLAFTTRAKAWLDGVARANRLAVDYVHTVDSLDDAAIATYDLILQLDFPPYGWGETASAGFERYIDEGRGGWVGLHHASLLGEFDGYSMWNWFSNLLGGIRYQNYIADFARGEVTVEDRLHPVVQGVPGSFWVDREEWYTYDRSPRPNVHVIASVDESTYEPAVDLKMGDHPVVWTNPNVAARNIYIFMGHAPELFDNDAYVTLLRNAILWAIE
jgi:hypothetical protein